MRARDFWKAVTVDESGFLDRLLALLEREKVRSGVVGSGPLRPVVRRGDAVDAAWPMPNG